MTQKKNTILCLTEEAISASEPLSVQSIRKLREQSKNAIFIFKAIFWVGIVVFNLALWVPLPIEINNTILNLIAFLSLAVAIVVPIIGLKRHQMNLELLKVNRNTLKKKTLSAEAVAYWEKVKIKDRPLINAEFMLLDGTKWSNQSKRKTVE